MGPGETSPNEASDYMIYLDWNLAPNSHSMDLPQDCWSTENYTASLAHKTNHSFHPNSVFCRFHHPRLFLLLSFQRFLVLYFIIPALWRKGHSLTAYNAV